MSPRFSIQIKIFAFALVILGITLGAVEMSQMLEIAQEFPYSSGLVALIALPLALFLSYLFCDFLTLPIQRLNVGLKKIAAGNFKVQLKANGSDELTELTQTFNEMAESLQARETLGDAINKFHSPEIVEKILSGELKLSGEHRKAVVLFADIRDFTSLCEKLSPEKVVELLNEYLSKMVHIIREHGGIVDKFVGDAIMALWGVPFSQGDDEARALKAVLAIRIELNLLNEARIARGEDPLRIGMGLTSGEIIAGSIGSQERMEYTAIGDAVNLASRIQNLTKERGLDILIDRNVAQSNFEKFILQGVGNIRVRGKAAPVEIFKVLGFVTETGERKIVHTPYSEFTPLKVA